MKSIYDFSVKDIDHEEISLEKFKGKTLLIVNVASRCGFTSQYTGLQTLYEKYKDKGLEILAFPCNQFGQQEKGNSEEIAQFCDLNFHTTFPLMEKIDVNGPNTHPLYKFLKKEQGGFLGSKIKWNFTKFLVDKNGKVVERYASITKPQNIQKDIEKIL